MPSQSHLLSPYYYPSITPLLRIPGPAGALAANDFGMYCKKRTHTCIPCAASCAARHYRWRAGGEALSEPLLPFHGGFTLLPLSLVALATGWAGLDWTGLGWLAGWLAAQRRLHSGWLAERITRPRGKARRGQARLTLHALGVQPFPLPSRHAKQRQCRLIKQASSQVERWYDDSRSWRQSSPDSGSR